MEKKLAEILANQYDNHILPFFWQHGEDDEVLVEEIERIHQSGIRAMCVESRPHEGFGKAEWWEDFDLILREARRRDMKVWLLDDRLFPTGYANGLIGEKYPNLRKWHLQESHLDLVGPMKDAAFLARVARSPRGPNEESLVAILACRRTEKGELLSTDIVDLTDRLQGDFVYWDVPEGVFRVFQIFKTREGSGVQPDYIHMLDPESVDVLIEAVYEPHFQRYKEDFGKTFAGFFSDEPCFGNHLARAFGTPGFYEYTLGIADMPLPWREDLPSLLSEHIGEDALRLLPGLWFDLGDKTSLIRNAYMDTITNLYAECFSARLGDWCRAHGVEYIGHIIEDKNAHARMGCSAGHYFRSLGGQDMAGIDVVLHQIVPGFNEGVHAGATGETDPAFFDYLLAKLAASLSHQNPKMHGRALCEIYGAYGWVEGLPMMKWLTDHMLVRGINHFVPHAFSPKESDPDCPPHFYARGENPQYRDFKVLMVYTNKMSHLLTGGRHIATAAILYHAEAEWSGGEYMLTEVPAKAVYDAQIDFDVVPLDALEKDAQVLNGRLVLQDERFDCLIVPYARILPIRLIHLLSDFADRGLCVIHVDGLPEKSCENQPVDAYRSDAKRIVLPVEKLAEFLTDHGFFDVQLKRRNRLLRFFHHERNGTHFYMFFNEGMTPVEETVTFPFSGNYHYIDLLQDVVEARRCESHELRIALSPYQSCVVAFPEESEDMPVWTEFHVSEEILLDTPFDISVSSKPDDTEFEGFRKNSPLFNITGPDGLPGFSGVIKYTTRFDVDIDVGKHWILDLGRVGETARVRINGSPVGTRICPPYRLDLTGQIRERDNLLEIEVANTLAFRLKDDLSRYLALPPSGLLGPVRLLGMGIPPIQGGE